MIVVPAASSISLPVLAATAVPIAPPMSAPSSLPLSSSTWWPITAPAAAPPPILAASRPACFLPAAVYEAMSVTEPPSSVTRFSNTIEIIGCPPNFLSGTTSVTVPDISAPAGATRFPSANSSPTRRARTGSPT